MLRKSLGWVKRKVKVGILKTCLAGRFDERNVLIITSSPRSGSTLLGQVLGAIPGSCLLFEPLHINKVQEAAAARFSWRTFVPVEEPWPEGEAFLRRVFEGRIVNDWTTREMSCLEACRSTHMLVKFVRANRLLPWMCARFKFPAPVLLIRHPCAVVASQLKYGWEHVKLHGPPRYLDRYPLFRDAFSKVQGETEDLAASWALDQLPPLLHETPYPWIIVTYEELVLSPESTLSRISKNWNLDIDMKDALSRLGKPSAVVGKSGIAGISGWKKTLTPQQVSQILRTVNAFGLNFYTQAESPDAGILYSPDLPENIRRAGMAP